MQFLVPIAQYFIAKDSPCFSNKKTQKVLNWNSFFQDAFINEFRNLLEDVSCYNGKLSFYARDLNAYLKRKEEIVKASNNSTSIYKNFYNSETKLTIINNDLYLSDSEKEIFTPTTISNSPMKSCAFLNDDLNTCESFYLNGCDNSNSESSVCTQNLCNDSPSSKFDDSHITRSASVDLFLNFDRLEENIINSNDSSIINISDQFSYIATAPVVSLKQHKKSVHTASLAYIHPPSTPQFHPLNKIEFNNLNTNFKYSNNMSLPNAPDESSWTSPPSSNPCLLQYKLAKQYNRNLQLPGVIGIDLDSESMNQENDLLKQDMKRFFARIYPPSRGTRYTALSDYLKRYPQCILDLLQGPFGHTAFENAFHLRCFNNSNFVNYSAETKAHEVIIPPPDHKKPLTLWIGTYGIPRDDKRHRGGEDVWFASNTLNAMGIADGVSEWMDLVGINPREFAEDLLKGSFDELYKLKSKNNAENISNLPPSKIANKALTFAYNNAKHYGSSTSIIGLLDPKTSLFGIANLGDSGCLILRRSNACGQLSVASRIKEMQHGFNVPYQFTHLPPPSEWDELKKKNMERVVSFAQSEYRRARELGKSIGDSPADIQSCDISVYDGDLIIIGSDGLFDNLFDYDITSLTALAVSPREAQLLYHNVRLATPPKEISRSLALAAYWKSLDPQAKTPFSKHSRKFTETLGLLDFNGGKEDDISITVAWVTAT